MNLSIPAAKDRSALPGHQALFIMAGITDLALIIRFAQERHVGRVMGIMAGGALHSTIEKF